jgi:4-amino-4-deoxy-L-arabinose transferase-like glycosyltransferase
MNETKRSLRLIWVVALGMVVRLGVMAPQAGRPLDDPDNYVPLARTLAQGSGLTINGRPTAYRPPLYPIVLAPLVAVLGDRLQWGVFGLHLALGAATIALTAEAARRWGMPPRIVLLAAAIVALDPVLVVQSRSVMTETLAAFLLAAALAALAEPSERTWLPPALGGLALGLAGLCRPSTLLVAVFASACALFAGPGSARERWVRSTAIGLATVATLAPWAWRNTRIFGEPVWTTTHGGYTLALANNPIYYAEVLDGPAGAVWSGANQKRWFDWVNQETAGMSEPAADRFLRAAGLQMLRERPRAFARASLARLGRFWGVAPSGFVYPIWLRVVTALWTVPLWLALATGLVRRDLWRWPRVAAPMVLLALSVVHAAYWTDLRMRAPIVPAIALAANWGLVRRRGADDR